MKKLVLSVMITILMASASFALPALDPGYSWVGADYWTVTDSTTVQNGSIFSIIWDENASYDSDFGIYTVDDVLNPTKVDKTFEIFAHDEEAFTAKSTYFKFESGDWSVSLDTTNWTLFDDQFGFYFGIHTGGLSDDTVDYTYYSDSQFNDPSSEIGVEHILIAYDGFDNIKLFLDDQLDLLPADRDYNDMIVGVHDVAPVPEPGTLILLGSGLAGLALFRRRTKN